MDQSGNLSEFLEKDDHHFKLQKSEIAEVQDSGDDSNKNSGSRKSRKSRLSEISVAKDGATQNKNFLGLEIEKDSIEKVTGQLPQVKLIQPF